MSFSSKKFIAKLSDSGELPPRAVRRVFINADIAKTAKLCAGDAIALVESDMTHGSKAFAVGIVWPSQDLPQSTVQISRSALLTAHIIEGGSTSLYPLSSNPSYGLPSVNQIKEAGTVFLKEITSTQSRPRVHSQPRNKGKRRDWLVLLLREHLVDLKYVTNTQILEVKYEGHTRQFAVTSVHPTRTESSDHLVDGLQILSLDSDSKPIVWIFGWDTVLRIAEAGAESQPGTTHKVEDLPQTREDTYQSIGGLDKQIAQIRDLLEIPLTRPDLFRHFGLKPPKGILLHGPPGTGKTHLARAIASSTRSSVLVINGPELSSAYHGETESKLRDVFKEAQEKSPCIVVLDEIDALVPRREDGAGGEVEKRVVATLLTILDGMEDASNAPTDGDSRVVVIGTTNRPNAIDPALRRPGRFDREIEIGIPDAEARLSILNVLLSKTPHEISQQELRSIASRSHGYVGADLSAVVRDAGTIAIKRWISSQRPMESISPGALKLTLEDLASSLPTVRPSAMRSLFFDTPPMRYSDIGGQASTIQKLREAVEWPLLYPGTFARLGIRPPKGVLLYGPPGCSKTILVRACACESGVNFVAVKGPELLNKYVGESERSVREIFRKARAAAPSIVFFDEIDALAANRSADTNSSSGSHDGVLTSLLNEMDGVQELLGVTVVAATNRPDVIDSALMRPGRFDRILYVGPPDLQAREDILKIRTRTMRVGPGFDAGEIAHMTDGCSGAEIAALCQDAALLTMRSNMNAPHVPYEAFVTAAKSIKRQITPEILADFEIWRKGEGS